jgi:thiol-disulfide isomerase/thioredoxin
MKARICVALFFALAGTIAMAQSLAGRWDGTLTVNGAQIPFRFEISGDGSSIQGTFFNGEDRFNSTSGKLDKGSLTLAWDYYASRLEATAKDGALDGKYTQAGRTDRNVFLFHATRYAPEKAAAGDAPSIAGQWVIPNKSAKGELAWRFLVRQSGADVSAAILRVDGDTGAITGRYRDGKFVLSHFDGLRPALMEITIAQDGSLEIVQNGQFGKSTLTAVRAEEARAKGLPEPTDPDHHTSVKDLLEPFRFSFPDLNGRLVSNTDSRFEGKVVMVNITGSWCPNCHDEAPFLAETYKKYRNEGLEIVALNFEEADQLANPTRLRAFIQKYGIEYPVLLCGEPGDAKDKLTQAVNWNSWPTTFFLGRDGRVRSVHAGFPSNGSGQLYEQAKKDFTGEVERLLHENRASAQ